MTEMLAELRALSDAEISRRHDQQAKDTVPSVNHYLQEIYRRDQNRQTVEMLDHTRAVRWMTWFMAALTVGNVLLVMLTLAPRS
jgi:hypothetical protein